MPNYLISHYEEIKKTGRLPLPEAVAIEPTYKCNLFCSICFYKKNGDSPPELKAEDFINFLRKIPNLTFVNFPGREPLLKEDFFKIVTYLSQKNIPMELLTNGTLVTSKNAPKIVYDKENHVMLSLDGNRMTHNKIRGAPFAYDRFIKAVGLLKNKCRLDVVCVINEKNLKILWKLPQIIKEIGLKIFFFEYERRYIRNDVVESSREMDGFEFADLKLSKSAKPEYSLAELKKNIEKMEKEAVKSGVEVGYLPAYFKEEMGNIYHRRLRKKYKCACNYLSKTRIDLAGNYMHCFAFRRPFGNILTSSLEEAWNSRKYLNFRKRILKNNLLPVCETCWGLLPVAKINKGNSR